MVKELQQLIKSPFQYTTETAQNIAEWNILKNYRLFPRKLLLKAPWNFKTEDAQKSEKLLASVKRNGQVVSCQVRLLKTGYYEVVDGNHRLDVFDRLKQEYILAYDHGPISENEAMLLAFQMKTEFAIEPQKAKRAMNSILADMGKSILQETVDLIEFGGLLVDTEDDTDEDLEPLATSSAPEKNPEPKALEPYEPTEEANDEPNTSEAVPEAALPETKNYTIRYELVFDNESQQDNWYRFLKHLKDNCEGETIAERIDNYLNINLWTKEK